MVPLLILPLPDLIHKGLSTQIMPCLLLLLPQSLLHHHLSGDASVVTTRVPQGGLAVHALPSCNGVLDRVGESMSQMKRACDIGWRNDHHELAIGVLLCETLATVLRPEEPLFLPPVVPGCLHVAGTVGVRHGTRNVLFLAWFRIFVIQNDLFFFFHLLIFHHLSINRLRFVLFGLFGFKFRQFFQLFSFFRQLLFSFNRFACLEF